MTGMERDIEQAANLSRRYSRQGHLQRSNPGQGGQVSDWRTRRDKRYARRVEDGGRLVAAHLPHDYHGKEGTYINHGCRCPD